jgi:ADP-ribose pyrophosphatase YjhB (NUDIX family)
MQHKIQKDIILKLIHKPKATFTELQGDIKSNDFAYHIKSLQNQGLVILNDNLYSLSSEGKKLSSFIEGDTGEIAKFPTFSNVLLLEKDGKFLAQQRLKEPFFGKWGFVSGKINFGFNIVECSIRDLLEEANLIAKKGKLVGISQIKTYEDDNLAFHHILFFVRLEEISGELKEDTHKAKNKWVTIEEFNTFDSFPDARVPELLNLKEFTMFETKRIIVNGKLTDGGTIKVN